MSERPDILPVAQSMTALRLHGHEWSGLCPLHKEKSPSFYVSPDKQAFFCHGCGSGGDVYTLVQRRYGVDFREAKRMLGSDDLPRVGPTLTEKLAPKRKTSKPPVDALAPEFSCFWGKPSHVWEYRDNDGSLIHYVARYETLEGKKTPQWTWDGNEWGMGHYSGKRPLYGLDKLAERPDAPVIVCEGEKASDAASILLPDFVAVTWSGGANAVGKADWSPLKGRKITIWPDADEAGIRAGNEILTLFPASDFLRFDGKKSGWDAADALDEGLKSSNILGAIRSAAPSVIERIEHEPEPPQPPFEFLGFDGDRYYYLAEEKRQIVELTASAHTQNNLLQLAGLDFWEGRYPASRSNASASWADAASDLMRMSHVRGIYNPDNVRGRGAWLDAGRRIVHLGGVMLIDGEARKPGRIGQGRYIYEARADLSICRAPPANNARANRLVQLCESLSWENPLSADLLAGWIVLAPICGILRWRPHIWVTGSAGSGKSTVTKDIVSLMVGQFSLKVEGVTTEPAIRQSMGRDARPVIFDEADAETRQDEDRVQRIINLARVSSSGGNISKGGANGKHMDFSVRSCFFFSSINTMVSQYADETRISKLVLKKDESEGAEENYARIVSLINELMTEQYAGEMFARSVEYMSVIEANCRTFVSAAARVFRDRRAADQVGTLLAGRYLCNSQKEIDLQTAIDWISGRSWNEHTALGASSDEMRLLTYLCSRTVRISSASGLRDVSIGEAIVGLARDDNSAFLTVDAKRILANVGIKVQGGEFTVANVSPALSKMLEGTPWSRDWKRPLRMVTGAVSSAKPVYFAPGLFERATVLPLKLIEA